MSSSAIAIPKRKQPLRNSSGSYQSSFGATPSSYGGSAPYLNGSPSQPGNLSKKPVRDEDESKGIQERRPSLLGKEAWDKMYKLEVSSFVDNCTSYKGAPSASPRTR